MPDKVAIGPFQVDLVRGRLLRDGIEREIRPQAWRALKVLVQSQGELVEYNHLIREAWDVHVSKHTVASTINEIKRVLEEYGSWIICRPKAGYRLELHRSDDLIRRGWHYRNQYTRLGFENALCCFRKAAADDSFDFRPFEATANIYLLLAGFLMRAPAEMCDSFREAHAKSALLCGLTPTIRLDRAFAFFIFERKLKEAEAELLALQSEMPRCVHIYVRLALIQLASGRIAAARSFLPFARACDPLAPELAFLEIVIHLFSREFEPAMACGRRAVELHPGSQIARAFYAEALDFAGDISAAQEQYRLAASISADATWIHADRARSLAIHGSIREAASIFDQLERRRATDYVDAYHMALLLDALGRREEALAEVARAWQENSYALLFSTLDAKAESLRSDPTFERLRKRMVRAAAA
ncbi:MAG TPA: winged helix-turn-helix domain-containing protein [Bryobacteraceae bacterium]|nr:winged helix-turn-helix domain-containing protein [Bryobacteraceae bacterium]